MLLQIAPYLGYLASFMLALGLLVNNDLKFRWFNTCGNVAFIIYGIIISAYPVLLTNVILICINVFYLYRIYNRKEYFELIEFDNGGVMVDRFLSFYKEDIANYFPDFNREQMIGNLNFVVLRDLVIANIFSAKKDEAGNAAVVLNYTVPKYRDFKVGRYIFDSEKEFLLSKGVRKVYYRKIANEKHKRFLEVTGFSTDEINDQPCIARNI